MAPSQDGERAERLTNTLFGAKDGGRHRQERALVLTSLRRTMRRCALPTESQRYRAYGLLILFRRDLDFPSACGTFKCFLEYIS